MPSSTILYHATKIMKDLVLVFRILNICADRVQDVPRYAGPMAEFLRLCSLPYLKEKESDELCFEQIAIESTDQLGMKRFRILVIFKIFVTLYS